MSNKWRKIGRGNILGLGTGLGKLRRNFPGRIVLKSGISPGLRRDSPTKSIHVFQRVAMIGIFIPELRDTVK